jgi:2-polyprenyl-3-methyl-5-hydroxy-6-metoxy-1,4-benzoquinol methylase
LIKHLITISTSFGKGEKSMEEVKTETTLSTQSYWDEVLAGAALPRINSPKAYHYRVTMKYIDKYISSGNYRTLLEIGCGSSGWLPYFAKKYNLKVSGLDYSDVGCRLAEENLKMLNINYGEIICNDLLASECTGGKKYDIIFSYGVIEHFEEPEKIIGIFNSLLNEGGMVITLVPNLNGFMGWVSRHFVPAIFKIHKVMSATDLRRYHECNQLINIKTGYAGTFTLDVVPLIKSERLKSANRWSKFTFAFINKTNRLITRLISMLRINLPSRQFSPYIITIANKSNEKVGE